MASFGSYTEIGLSNITPLRSCALSPASIWLDTLPTSMVMSLSRNISLAYKPPNTPDMQCTCRQHVEAHDVERDIPCSTLKEADTSHSQYSQRYLGVYHTTCAVRIF